MRRYAVAALVSGASTALGSTAMAPQPPTQRPQQPLSEQYGHYPEIIQKPAPQRQMPYPQSPSQPVRPFLGQTTPRQQAYGYVPRQAYVGQDSQSEAQVVAAKNIKSFSAVRFMFGPLRLGLWLALSVIRVPLSVVLWVGEACLFGVSVVIDALKLILQTVPSVARLAFRAGCLSVWVAAVLGIYQLSYEEGGELMVMVRDVARHCAMFVCAARHLPVPWGVNGVSDSQLSRAWRMFALVHHPDKNGDSSIATFVCVQQALQMLKEHEGLMRLWVLARPLLAIPPWLAAPLAFAAACTLAHWWRPPLLLPSRCLPPRAAARTPRAPVPPVAMPIAQPHFLSSG